MGFARSKGASLSRIPAFRAAIVESGAAKYFLDVSEDEQEKRFHDR